MLFEDRSEAGRLLADRLRNYENRADVCVLALPRGGVPVAYEVAKELNAPLDVFIVRKLGVPGQEELAMGAIATGGIRILNEDVIRSLRIPIDVIHAVTEREEKELERRERLYRGDAPTTDLRGKTVIVVDDGLATGSSMKVALSALRERHPAKLIAAVPTAPAEICDSLHDSADEVVCAVTPEPFLAVGASYRHFDQTADNEVRELIKRAA